MGQATDVLAQRAKDAAELTIFNMADPINESVNRFFSEQNDEAALRIYNGQAKESTAEEPFEGKNKAANQANGLESHIRLYVYCLFEMYWWPWTRGDKRGAAKKLIALEAADHEFNMMVGIEHTVRVMLRRLVEIRKEGGDERDFTDYIFKVAEDKCRNAFFRKLKQAKFEGSAMQTFDDLTVEDMNASDEYKRRMSQESGPSSYRGTNDPLLVDDPADIVIRRLTVEEIEEWLTDDTLTDLQRKVLLYRYDWDNLGSVEKRLTLSEVAKIMNVSTENVRKHEKKAITALARRWEASQQEGL